MPTLHAMTQNETLVYNLLCQADRPLSAYNILDALRDKGIRAPLQVYRALAKLVERGAVHRIESVNGFVACQLHDCGGSEVSIFSSARNASAPMNFPMPASVKHCRRWVMIASFRPRIRSLKSPAYAPIAALVN